MNGPALSELRACFEGLVPATMCTVAADGTPNVAYVSQVFHVDAQHVALSFQFFNKTRQNILANPQATALLLHPLTGGFYRLHLRYLRTETAGGLFERMKAQLAGIASHSGMEDVFRLLGTDVYRVEQVEALPGQPLALPPPRGHGLAAVRACSEAMAAATALDELLDAALGALCAALGVGQAMVLMLDAAGGRLYTVASRGYATSGVGSELQLGEGVIGVAARERTPIRIGHMSAAYRYTQAMRSSLQANVPDFPAVHDIPYPGLASPRSQLAAPMLSAGRVVGVLFAESPEDLRFDWQDEDALVAIANHLGAAIDLMQSASEPEGPAQAEAPAPAAAGEPLAVRYHASNGSIFLGEHYLIKGVAGAILWKLLRLHREGRSEFSNRELRLDASLGLPEVSDNLEARLLLLARRLAEHGAGLRIEKTGRGRFRLAVPRPVSLTEG